jgi:TRAP-type C4-dicarboxylate transport system substrate-binding protein
MTQRMTRASFSVLLAAAALAQPLAVRAADPVKLKLAFFADDTEMTWVTVIKPFVDNVNRDAKGTIEIDPFLNGALGRALPDQPQMVLDGVADIAFCIPGVTPGRFADNGVMELPGLFRNLRESSLVYTRMVAANRLRGFENYDVIGAIGTPPFSVHSKTKVTSLADLRGLRVRTTNATEAQTLKELGAIPVLMPVNEVPEAIGRGTIDAATVHPGPLFDFGINKVTKYDYFIGFGFSPLNVLMNKKVFDGLPKPGQDAIRKYSGEWFATTYIKGYSAYTDSLMTRLRADTSRTVTFPTPADDAAAQAAFKPVFDAWLAKDPRNPQLLKDVQTEIARVRSSR